MVPRLLCLLSVVAAAACVGCSATDRTKVEQRGLFALWEPPTPAEAARMMADPFDADKRYKGVTWISNAPWGGADIYVRVYREMVTNDKEDPGVRAVAARALGFHGTPQDAVLILPLLKNDDKRVRQTTARALQRLCNPEVIPALVPMVDPLVEPDHDTRQAVVCALGMYPDERAMAALIAGLNDDDLAVSRTSRQSLRVVTGTDQGEDPKAWIAWATSDKSPFAGQTKYLYPNFWRAKHWWEFLPLVPPPPNEPSSTPIGYRPPGA